MANAKSALEKVRKEFGIKSSTTPNKNDNGKQNTSASPKSSTTTKTNTSKKNTTTTKTSTSTNNKSKAALEKVREEFGIKSSTTSSKPSTTKKYTDFNTESKRPTDYSSTVKYLQDKGVQGASGIMTETEWRRRNKSGGTYQNYLDEQVYLSQSVPLKVDDNGIIKKLGNISVGAYKAIEGNTLDKYVPKTEEEGKTIAEFTKFAEEYAKKQREPENFGQGLVHGIGYTAEKIGAGAVSGIADAGNYLWAGALKLLSIPTWGSWEESINKNAEYMLSNPTLGDIWNNSVESRYRVPDWYRANVGQTAGNFGSLLPAMAAEVYTMGGSPLLESQLATQATNLGVRGTMGATAKSLTTKLIKPKASDVVFGLSAAGSAAKAGYAQSGDIGKALNYGVLNGLGEVATEKLFGGLGGTGIGADDLIDLGKVKGINKIANNKYGSKVLGLGLEGVEEMIMAEADPVFQMVTVNPNAEFADFKDLGESGFQGVLLSAFSNVATFPLNKYSKTKTIQILNRTSDSINALLVAEGDKLEPLKNNASYEEMAERQNQIKVFKEAYAEILENQVATSNPEIFTEQQTPDTIEQAAREVVAEKNRTSTPLHERLEAQSRNNEPITVSDAKKVTGFGDRGAELVAKTANSEGATFYETVAEVKPSYFAGFNNPDMDIKKVAHTFTSQAQEDAYTAGQKDAIMQNTVAEAKAKNARVFGAESGVIENEQAKEYSPRQLRMADTIGKDLGSQVSFEERLLANEETGAEANAWHQNGEIKISRNSDNKFIEDIMEESLHRIGQIDTEAARVLRTATYEFVTERERSRGVEGITFDEEKALYDNAGESIDTRGIVEEVSVGTLATELFRNEKEWLRWRAKLDTDSKLRQAWYKLMDIVSEIIWKIEKLLAEKSFSNETREKVNKELAELKHLKGLYTDAYIATKDAVDEKTNNKSTEAQTETRSEVTQSPVASENKAVNKETPAKTKNKPQTKNKAVKVGETFTANGTGKTYTITGRSDTHTTYTVTDKNGKTTTREVTNTAADINFNRAGEEGFTKVQNSTGIKSGKITDRMKTALGGGEKSVGIADGQAYVSNGNLFIAVDDMNVAKNELGATESEKVGKNVSKLLEQSSFVPIFENPVEGNLKGVGTVRVFTDIDGREIAVKKEVAEYLEGYNLGATFRGGKPYAIKATDNNGNVAGVAMAVWMDTSGQKYKITDTTTGIKAGDVFVADKGIEYKIISRDAQNTTVEISSEKGSKTMVIANEVADNNFSNIPKEGITKWIDEDMHIDNRTWEDVGSRSVKAFQFLFPEMQEYYRPLAQELLWDLDNTVKGERILTGSYEMGNEEWIGVERITSDAIATIKDSTNATYDDIRNALNRLINDEGQENIALAKRIELVLDGMLTDGYNTFDGMKIPPNEEYIAKKEELIGKTYEGRPTFDEWDDLPIFSLKAKGKNAATKSTNNLEIKINEEYNGSVEYSLKNNRKVKSEQYGVMWTLEAGALENNEVSAFYEKISETKNNKYSNYRVAADGQLIYEIGDKLVYTDGDYYYPHISKVIAFNTNDNYWLEYGKESFYDGENYGYQTETIIEIVEAVLGEGAVETATYDSYETNKRSGRPSNERKTGTETNRRSQKNVDQKNFSLKDSKGKALTQAQAEYFKDSKVRDENGNLLVMYQGASEDFTVFDRKKSSYANLYGRGFYFTKSENHASQYGNTRAYYLDIKHPVSTTETTITKSQLRKFLQAVSENEDYSFENYGYGATVDSVLQSTYGKSDFLMLNDVSQTAIGDLVEAVELFNEINGSGYDGIVLDTETVTFNSEQAKLTTNTNPTSNPDINFSLKKPVEETRNLIAVHNMQVSELERTLDLGGLPMPSIAIIKAQSGHSEYGDVSLVFSKDTIDPKGNKDNKVYGGDAWTPTYPKIEYKPNAKMAKKISDKYYELSRTHGYDESKPLYSYVYDLEEQLNRNNGEVGMLNELYKDTRLMQLYLLDSGKEKVETIKKEIRTELTDEDVKFNEFFIKELGAEVMKDFKWDGNGSPFNHRVKFMEKYEGAIRDAYKKLLTEEYHFSDEQTQNVLDSTKKADYLKFMRNASVYSENGRVTIKTEDDYEATQKAIREAVGEDYHKWVDALFKGIEEKSGIRNNADYFTNNGNRRSWEALHWENNLENVVKVMKGNTDVGGGTFFTGHSIWGVSAKNYRSVDEIKADSDRLKQLPEEEYNQIKEGFGERLTEIAHSIMDKSERNPFIASDNAMECIVDAVRSSKTKSGILNQLKQYKHLTVTETTVDDIVSLVSDIANMPTEYFEAKPKRAVGLDEIATAIIPDKTSESTKARLADMGIKYLEYETGNEEARLKALNALEDVKFSLKGGISPMELLDTIEKAQKGKKGAAEKLAKYVDSGMIRTKTYDELIEKYGIIPSGERPHREVQVPRKSGKNKKVSQTVRTILEAEVTPDEAVPTIEKMVEDGIFSYDVYTDKQAIENGEEYIKTHGWEQSLIDWFEAVNSGEVSKDITTTGWILYNHAANSGDTKTAIMILDAMVRHQRSAAQALQATRILKKLSPEAQLYGVQKSVQAFQKELTEKYGDKAPDLEINEELAEQFLTAETEEERAKIEKEIYKDIGRQMPSRFIDKWNAWRYLAMLGNARTHIRNIFGNAFFAPVVATKNLTATAIESAVYRVSGKKTVRGKSLVWGSKTDRALLKAAWSDYGNVADLVSNGGKYNDSAMANQHIQEGRQIFKGIGKFNPLEWARKGNSKALEFEDTLFSKPHYAYALAQYCKAHNITPEQISRGKAIAPAREYAIKEAQKATYRDTNAFSQFVSELGRSGNKKNPISKGASIVLEGILPFRKTPANILVRGIEYSPLGLLKGLSYDLVQVSKGKMTASEAIDHISAGLTGTGLLGLGIYLAAQGLVRGHGEDEEDEKKFNELMGHQSYALELPNGESITLDWLAPEALPFFVGVNIWETSKGSEEEATLSSILQSTTNITEPMLEMSCLQGLNDLIEGMGYASSNDTSGLVALLSSATTSYLMQILPTLSGQAERTSEEERMTTYTEKNDFLTGDMQYTLGKASAKIPFWDYNQIPYIDAWGRKEASGTALKRGLNNFLNPAYTSTIESSKMEEELLRLYEQTGEGGVFPERADKYFTVDGERKDLTAEEYVRYATLKGEKSYRLVTDLLNSKAYRKLTDAEKVKAIKETYDYANQKAKQAISNYKPDTWVKKADEFGSNVGNYISFKTEVSGTKEANGGKISKQQVVDIVQNMSQNDSEAWKMYLSMYDSNNDLYAYNAGIEGETYMYFLETLNEYDTPTKSGKYGTYTQDEAERAIRNIEGLSREERAILWQSVNTSWKAKNNPWR